MPAGISKFKISSADSRMVDIGASDAKANQTKGSFTVNAGKPLAWAGMAVWFEPPRAGKYAITLEVVDPQAPILTITPLE